MGKEQAKTISGFNLFEISSLIQKALRRQDAEMAVFAAYELLPKYRKYLWKRMLTVSAEDCHDFITDKILELHNKDYATLNSTKYIEESLNILLQARKCRDADYVACNLFNSRDRVDLEQLGYGQEEFEPQSATKNGHNVFHLANVFDKSIDDENADVAGYCANEMRVYYPNFCWDVIERKASAFKLQQLSTVVSSLRRADAIMNFDNTLLMRSKAIVFIIGVHRHGLSPYIYPLCDNFSIDLTVSPPHRRFLPDYVYDCHTYRGKMLGKTKRQFVKAEQEALCPKKEGMFDRASWERYFFMEENGFWTDQYTPRPSEQRVQEIDYYYESPTLF